MAEGVMSDIFIRTVDRDDYFIPFEGEPRIHEERIWYASADAKPLRIQDAGYFQSPLLSPTGFRDADPPPREGLDMIAVQLARIPAAGESGA